MLTIKIITFLEATGEADVITFKADQRDAESLIHIYCSGVQASQELVIICGNSHIIGTAGEMIQGKPGLRHYEQLFNNRFAR